MKSENEIRQKLEYYRGILAGMEAGRVIYNPEVFLKVSKAFPGEALEMLSTTAKVDELVSHFSPEDQEWIRRWFGSLSSYARQVITSRVAILGWIIDEAGIVEGGDPSPAKIASK